MPTGDAPGPLASWQVAWWFMCGIIGVVGRQPTRPTPTRNELIGGLDAAIAALPDIGTTAGHVAAVDASLRGVPGILALAGRHELVTAITARLDGLDAFAAERERALEADTLLAADELEAQSAALIALQDSLWAIRNDRLRAVREVAALAGRDAGEAALAGYFAVQQSLSAIDRLEVRGRDSAGLHLFVRDHGLDDAIRLSARAADTLFQSGSVRRHGDCLSFVYKAAAEIGELGDNTAALRAAIAGDDLLRQALAGPNARITVLGHTRWASVGIISEPNAHPVNSESLEAMGDPYVVAALNGDVDNHADLAAKHELQIADPITTDAKVIPVLMAQTVGRHDLDDVDAFRRTVSQFEGSVAIAMSTARDPGGMLLALRGSGQALYVGLADDCYVVASEPYGLVEETQRYVRMDGERGGQIVALDGELAGELAGITYLDYNGTAEPVTDGDVVTTEITTRDIDRGEAPHFLLKEIAEAPESLRKTLRGRILEGGEDGLLRTVLGDRAMPERIARRLADGEITRVRVIGQGTAAVAGQSMAAILDDVTEGALDVDAITATELSGFNLRLDMRDTLAIAISQSGTTTDTNRTVDLLRARGAAVLAIVNRRSSDLCDKADGVLYTSDGRDVEMSVASTKAFYAQVAAGALLACALSATAGLGSDRRRHQLLDSLRALPDALHKVLALRGEIADAAHRFAPLKRYWAVVGNGPNKVAAEEVRIKLSELCYKSIACDVTEDKKHIDLSSEPLILVCGAGLSGSNADDVGKEIAIFGAHKATAIAVVDEGSQRYDAAALIQVPPVDPALGFVLSAMVGHLFGYEAALAIDASALPLRRAREAIERLVGTGATGDEALAHLPDELRPPTEQYLDGVRAGRYNGHLEASTAVALGGLLRNMVSSRPLEGYQRDTGKVATPGNLIDDLVRALTQAIDELTRPIDAIKHQAKTVTVGISRSDEGVLDRALVQAVLAAGAGRDVLAYRTLKVLADLDPAVGEVTGFTRYRIDGDTIAIVDRGGIARSMTSRAEGGATLVGTKRRVATQQEVLVARGRRDGRTLVFVPEVKAGDCTGITLLHVRFHDRLDARTMRSVLTGYDHRYDRLVDWVSETEGAFDDSRLAELPVETLLIDPISDTADRWRTKTE